ncbi:methylated-DNA--[protein]-cysteine S-methyltransferase [Solihabitans fulvus]|uniref:methylated-DNA--[protein]-cysteine S-methyltransferase n=1 Tax=Solihabitans fulvus TaxID=1892852 RepID=A0A5B2X8B8_9PSEU|nr:methylated-DNA--[protein]-cysteine S-methyltransferase [Solihabitans fulvus]KAA2259396.1 methylated-DNA--[protein]-cysteine S-methyltransferase [Solihabitans fulvus]
MTKSAEDALVEQLSQLGALPPNDLLGRVAVDWVSLPATVGRVYVAFSGHGISYLRTADSVHGEETEFLESYRRRFGRPLRPASRPPAGLAPALRTGRAKALTYDLRELSSFERAVLTAIQEIPHGQTRPYSWVAREVGHPGAARAVGSALGRNPVPVLIPCHRVTRADGQPGDYVFGQEAKESLLRAEDVDLDEVRELAAEQVFYLGSDTTNIVCFPTCHNARRISAAHRRGFRDVVEAEEAGYRPCQHCRPESMATA